MTRKAFFVLPESNTGEGVIGPRFDSESCVGRDPLIVYNFVFLCQIVAPFKRFEDIHHILLYAKGRDDLLT